MAYVLNGKELLDKNNKPKSMNALTCDDITEIVMEKTNGTGEDFDEFISIAYKYTKTVQKKDENGVEIVIPARMVGSVKKKPYIKRERVIITDAKEIEKIKNEGGYPSFQKLAAARWITEKWFPDEMTAFGKKGTGKDKEMPKGRAFYLAHVK